MNNIQSLEIKVRPKFVIDTDTAYQCLTLVQMYCDSHNKTVESSLMRCISEEDADWHTNLEFKDVESEDAYKKCSQLNDMQLIPLDDVIKVFIDLATNYESWSTSDLEFIRNEFEQKVILFGAEIAEGEKK